MGDVVVPRTTVLPLSNGRAVTVREELNHGETIAMYARMYRTLAPEVIAAAAASGMQIEMAVDPLKTGDALTVAYVVDWTLTDGADRPLEIRGLAPNEFQDVLNNLKHPVAVELKRAIEAHANRVAAAAADLKKTPSTGEPSPATSPSAG